MKTIRELDRQMKALRTTRTWLEKIRDNGSYTDNERKMARSLLEVLLEDADETFRSYSEKAQGEVDAWLDRP